MNLGMFVTAAAKAFNTVNTKGSNRNLWEDRGSKTDGFDVCRVRLKRKGWCLGLSASLEKEKKTELA